VDILARLERDHLDIEGLLGRLEQPVREVDFDLARKVGFFWID
jgi:hypothetical protein